MNSLILSQVPVSFASPWPGTLYEPYPSVRYHQLCRVFSPLSDPALKGSHVHIVVLPKFYPVGHLPLLELLGLTKPLLLISLLSQSEMLVSFLKTPLHRPFHSLPGLAYCSQDCPNQAYNQGITI